MPKNTSFTYVITILIIITILIQFAACIPNNGQVGTSKQGTVYETSTGVIIKYESVSSNKMTTSLPEIAYSADIIVIGKVKPTNSYINGARKADDCSQPDSEHYSIGHVYEMDVKDYVQGDGPKKLLIIGPEGYIWLKSLPSQSHEEIEKVHKEKEGKTWKPLKPEKTYLLFLKQLTGFFEDDACVIDGYPINLLYVPANFPWILDVDNPDQVVPEDVKAEEIPIDQLLQAFPGESLDSMLQKIKEPYTPPTPEPTLDYRIYQLTPKPDFSTPTIPVITPSEPYPFPSLSIETYPGP
jgi:hypothetical protein